MINRQQSNNHSDSPRHDFLNRLIYQLKKTGFKVRIAGKKLLAAFSNFSAGRRKKMSQRIRRLGKERIYRLKGYTTVAKINRKRHAERQQRFLRKFLFLIISFLILILLFTIYNPFKDLSELYRIIGIKDFSDLTQTIDISEQNETTTGFTTESKIIINTTEFVDENVE